MTPRPSRRGAALLLALGLLAVLGMASAVLWAHLHRSHDLLRWETRREIAYHLAEGGLDYALAHLRNTPDFREAADLPLGRGRFSVSVTALPGGFAILSTGTVGEGPAALRVHLTAHARIAADGSVQAWTQERVRR